MVLSVGVEPGGEIWKYFGKSPLENRTKTRDKGSRQNRNNLKRDGKEKCGMRLFVENLDQKVLKGEGGCGFGWGG